MANRIINVKIPIIHLVEMVISGKMTLNGFNVILKKIKASSGEKK